MVSFTGEYVQKIDGKGRMSVPADFRRVLESHDPDWAAGTNPGLYLLYGDHLKNCLRVYTVAAFRQIADDIQKMPQGSPGRRIASRLILGQSVRLEVDKDGRTVMPSDQRAKLGLAEGELRFTGAGDHFEIWENQTFADTITAEVEAFLATQGDDFDPLSLLQG
ncbi:division/cell wall cluster transcriptional repressor MraZ [Ketogulonicigenium vulgare]|uniref:Transcriptional regulator MraZ n=2 Tax=Ketogulonicigenium vulgare TaxID=92945 RepID=F9Y991_KETVW|nr:MraZ family transcriptional regulator [Ketogulonicigenium vulgare]ADO41565.1 MraZ, putative [Ketogulonicigenium vulgare Y25]AEM41308.1 MraZ, putative [Ketogulonicigenium vulgare WSH-001]ALJ81445.1 MraZ family transcriptional regulator [Ketogulonicigenium vulgare]ANW35088.1 cell division/cell wall cluster transcriptional repressor MraZ [Ketogulonicigenium vulgare]AOZ55044.1 MraZ [Ketogulonicigenium vulgare]